MNKQSAQPQPQSLIKASRVLNRKGSVTWLFNRVSVLFLIVLTLGLSAFAQEDLLRSVIPDFKGTGVSVRTQWSTSNVTPSRPTLAPLRGFPITNNTSLGSQKFSELFNAGAFQEAALVAVNDGQIVDTNPRQTAFEQRWKNANKAQRVFISFSKADIETAKTVRYVLERNGYICFIYINETGQRPWTNSVKVGQFFRNAGTHLVIDSKAARRSAGVQLEAQALNIVEGRSPRPSSVKTTVGETSRPRTPTKTKETGFPCCKLCHYRNGILIGCGPVTCGPHCIGAR